MGKAKRDLKAERELFALHDAEHHSTFVLASRRIPASARCDGYIEHLRAKSFHKLSRVREAIVEARKSLAGAPLDFRHHAYCSLGEILFDTGRFEEAVEQFQEAIRHNPKDANAYYHLGGIYALRGQFKKSSELRERATQCKAGTIDEAWLNLGYLRAAQERYLEARDCFQRALEITARYREARVGLREIELILAGIPKISLNALRAKIKRINSSKASFPNYIILLTREFLKEADPDDAFILYLHCQALGQVARYDEAMALLPKIFEVLPKRENCVWHEFATIHARMMNFKESARYFRKALACQPGYVVSCRDFGILRRKQGRFVEAEKLLRLAVRKDSENDYHWEELGNLYRSTERFAKAARCYERALKLNPKLKEVRVALEDVRAAQRWWKLHGKKR